MTAQSFLYLRLQKSTFQPGLTAQAFLYLGFKIVRHGPSRPSLGRWPPLRQSSSLFQPDVPLRLSLQPRLSAPPNLTKTKKLSKQIMELITFPGFLLQRLISASRIIFRFPTALRLDAPPARSDGVPVRPRPRLVQTIGEKNTVSEFL
jgi:hypothetical protein